MPTKVAIIDAVRSAERDLQELVSSTPESAWANPIYDSGWNAKQVLCHLALTARVANLLIGLLRLKANQTRCFGLNSRRTIALQLIQG